MWQYDMDEWPGVPDLRPAIKKDTFKSDSYHYAINESAYSYVSRNEYNDLRSIDSVRLIVSEQ